MPPSREFVCFMRKVPEAPEDSTLASLASYTNQKELHPVTKPKPYCFDCLPLLNFKIH